MKKTAQPSVVKTLKDNWFKSASFVTVMVALFTGLWTFDAHYAKAADLDTLSKRMDTNQQSSALELQIQLNKQWVRNLENQLDDIEAKIEARAASKVDQSKRPRVMKQIEELKKDNNRLERQKFELQVPK